MNYESDRSLDARWEKIDRLYKEVDNARKVRKAWGDQVGSLRALWTTFRRWLLPTVAISGVHTTTQGGRGRPM